MKQVKKLVAVVMLALSVVSLLGTTWWLDTAGSGTGQSGCGAWKLCYMDIYNIAYSEANWTATTGCTGNYYWTTTKTWSVRADTQTTIFTNGVSSHAWVGKTVDDATSGIGQLDHIQMYVEVMAVPAWADSHLVTSGH